MALQNALTRPRPGGDEQPARTHLRRCTYRRLTLVSAKPVPRYDASCLYPDRAAPVPLGDLASARSICDDCQALKIFRADED